MTTATIRRLGYVMVIAGALCAPATAAAAQAPAPPLPPGIGAKLLQGPADSVTNPRAHEYIIDNLAPGTTISRQIGFSNGDTEPVYLSFYAVAADIHDGIFQPGDGRAANELTTWTTFSPTSATVPPGQTLPVTVTIAVPANATAGERYAAALADDTTPAAAGGGITSVSRVGIRIYLSIGPGGGPKTAFSIDSMTAHRTTAGNPVVTARVHNTGGRAVDLSGHLELTNGPSLMSAGPFPVATVDTLAPGQSGQVSIVLDPTLPNGPWDARITLVSGLTSSAGTARLTFPAAPGASAAPTVVAAATLPRHPGTSPILIGVIALGAMALLLFLLTVFWVRPGRAGRHQANQPRFHNGGAAAKGATDSQTPNRSSGPLPVPDEVVAARL
jgi:hypothetical protein